MKKTIILIGSIVVIPFLVVCFFIKDNPYKTVELVSNTSIRVKRLKSNKVEKIPIEEYVVGVIAGEMPTTFHIEAMKAQAVASRSYAIKRIEYNKNEEYDVVDSVLNQVYLDNSYLKKSWGNKYEKNLKKIRYAVYMTTGEVLMYEGKVADALFFSTSNGKTEDSNDVFGFSAPYLKSVDSNWDKETSTVFNSTKEMSKLDFYTKLELKYEDSLKVEILKKTETGRVVEAKINDVVFKGQDIASKLELRSSTFQIEKTENNITIKVTGFGHGVGMSQYGALGMANEGYKYNEILEYYYIGTIISKT